MKNYFLVLLVLIFNSCNRAEEEIIIVPENYVGYVVLIFNQENKAIPEYYNDKRVYRIPPDGILKTKFSENDGCSNLPDFYYGKVSEDKKIKSSINKAPSNTVVVSGGSSGSMNIDLAGKNSVKYRLYYVGDEIQRDSAFEKASRLDFVEIANSK